MEKHLSKRNVCACTESLQGLQFVLTACFLLLCRIKSISANGLLTIHYPGVLERGEEEHYADPSDMEVVDIAQCKSALEVYDVGSLLFYFHFYYYFCCFFFFFLFLFIPFFLFFFVFVFVFVFVFFCYNVVVGV